MLLGGQGERFRPGSALLWSLTWAVGAALGVALGGWLTLVGGSGAPGIAALDPLSDLVVLPGIAFVVVFVAEFSVRLAIAAIRGRAVEGGNQQDDE